MKVFIAGTSFRDEYGGPAVSVSSLALALADAGADVGVWAPDGSVNIHSRLQSERALQLFSGPATTALRRFGKPDVIHDNGIWMPHNHWLTRFSKENGVTRVVSTRGMLEPRARSHKYLKKTAAWWAYQKRDLAVAKCLHATSQEEASNLKRLLGDRAIRCIPNGLDLHAEAFDLRGSSLPKIALFMGRICPIKGLPLLINAWARVRPQNWILQIAGPDERGHEREVRELIERAHLEDCIDFLGPVRPEDKWKVYAAAELFILPSHSESFGMVIAEALSSGCPVITTTGVPWPSIEQQRLGWRVAATVDGMELAVREATKSTDAELRAMGSRGRRYVEDSLGWRRLVKDYAEMYVEAMST